MKKYRLSYSEALQRVKAKRKIIRPNEGFVTQLELYKDMGWTINRNHTKYKLFQLNLAAYRMRANLTLPQHFRVMIKPDPGLTESKPDPNVIKCRKCSRVLASESNLFEHQHKQKPCNKTLFIEPIVWMKIDRDFQGKLQCPKCEHEVGSFSWIRSSWCECECGKQMVPALYLVPSEVDRASVVENVEMAC
ncbi:hypothetical protein D910_11301 [Dendroctonus ponderosae]